MDTSNDVRPTIKWGLYRHYKGNLYHVIGVARHSETDDYVVVYRKLYDDYGLSVRPYDMFIEDVEVDGVIQPRFEFQTDESVWILDPAFGASWSVAPQAGQSGSCSVS